LRERGAPLVSLVVGETRRQRRTNAHRILASESGGLLAAKHHRLQDYRG
jgi:hypothetical protein